MFASRGFVGAFQSLFKLLDVLVPFMGYLDAHVHAYARPLELTLGYLGASWGQLGAILSHLGMALNSKNIDFPWGI